MAAGLDGEGYGKVRFPDARRSQKNHVLVLRQEGQIEELHHRLLVQMGMEAKVVFLDGLRVRQPRQAHRHVDPSLLLCRNLFFEEPVEEREIGHLLTLGEGNGCIEDLVHPRELQSGDILLEPLAGQLLHDAPARRSYSSRDRVATSG